MAPRIKPAAVSQSVVAASSILAAPSRGCQTPRARLQRPVPGIGVITNPRSKANKHAPQNMYRLGYMLGTRGSAEATRSLDDLYRVAEEFKAAGIDILGINGGDGTVHVTLTAFIKVYAGARMPKIALLRGGTLNTIAGSFGIKGSPQSLLYNVADKYHNGEQFITDSRNVLQVNDKYGLLFGTGLVYNFMEAYYATRNPSPLMGALVLARTVGSALVGGKFARNMARRVPTRVSADGVTWARQDFLTVLCGAVADIGIGFKPWYRCLETPGKFAAVGIHCSTARLVFELLNVFRGRPIRRDKAIDETASHIRMESDEPIGFILDGDKYKEGHELDIRSGPKLDFILR